MGFQSFIAGTDIMPPAMGQIVDDFTFRRGDGALVRISDFGGKPLLLVFLRHLA
jgi:peroxiredoxin